MAPVPNNLLLDDRQLEVLAENGITEGIYVIKGELLHRSAVRIDGYTNGHYVFFLTGEAAEHVVFLRHLYGENYPISMPTRFRGITIYGSPSHRFMAPENRVNIQPMNTVAPITYAGQ
jgi:hypothetical protein